ncbi:hypothetical protein CCYA_CCYA02G0583 [Cyanidiococcus yangmingshanensis]|nr:hypothetical protein CCYA_CCYA02G0583 [Cyanidiococcus yangmingshanensis]
MNFDPVALFLRLVVFRYVDAPAVHLELPSLPRLRPLTLFLLFLGSYMLLTGGITYDIIVGPPSVGQRLDSRTGAVVPVAIARGQLTSQYVIEGIFASLVHGLAVIGLVILDYTHSSRYLKDHERSFAYVAGISLTTVAMILQRVLMSMKLPNYMRYGNA